MITTTWLYVTGGVGSRPHGFVAASAAPWPPGPWKEAATATTTASQIILVRRATKAPYYRFRRHLSPRPESSMPRSARLWRRPRTTLPQMPARLARGSPPRHQHGCAENGRNRARTCDLPRVKRTLSQLSYAPWERRRIPRARRSRRVSRPRPDPRWARGRGPAHALPGRPTRHR